MLNGTLKDSEICHNCGETVGASTRPRHRSLPSDATLGAAQGHRIWNCPKREKWKPTETAIPKEAQAAVRHPARSLAPLPYAQCVFGGCV